MAGKNTETTQTAGVENTSEAEAQKATEAAAVETTQDQGVSEKQKSLRERQLEDMYAARRRDNSERTTEAPVEAETEPNLDDELVDLKVDGKIIQKPKAEVEAAGGATELQKALSADAKLKKAAAERRQLEEEQQRQQQYQYALEQREAEIERKLQELESRLTAQPAQEQAVNNQPDVDIDEVSDRFIKGVYAGNENEAKEALREIVKSVRPVQQAAQPVQQPEFNSDEIVSQAAKKAAFEAERNLGKRDFQKQYSHLAKDENLFAMTNTKTAELLQQNPDWSPYDIIMEAGRQVDEWAKSVVGEDIVDERTEKKRQNQQVPVANARKEAAPGYKPKTREEIMAEYKANRPYR